MQRSPLAPCVCAFRSTNGSTALASGLRRALDDAFTQTVHLIDGGRGAITPPPHLWIDWMGADVVVLPGSTGVGRRRSIALDGIRSTCVSKPVLLRTQCFLLLE